MNEEQAEHEFQEYLRLVEVMHGDPSFKNASATAKQWWRFLGAYAPVDQHPAANSESTGL